MYWAVTGLEIRHVNSKGRETRHTFNPFWVRLDVTRDVDDRVTRIAIKQRTQRLEIGAFLTPVDKGLFATGFGRALHKARA